MSIFQSNDISLSVDVDDDQKEDEADQQRINEELANEMSELSSDGDFIPGDFSEFHRELRRNPANESRNYFRTDMVAATEDFQTNSCFLSEEQYNSELIDPDFARQPTPNPIIYKLKNESERKINHGNITVKPLLQGELDQAKALYSASQRRVHDLTTEIERIKYESHQQKNQLLHQVQAEHQLVEETQANLKKTRSELEQRENKLFEVNKRLVSFEKANQSLTGQNQELEDRLVAQISQIETLETEIRLAQSDDKQSSLSNQRRLDELQRIHEYDIEKMQKIIDDLNDEIDCMKISIEAVQDKNSQAEKRLNRERVESGETINRLNMLLKEAQGQLADQVPVTDNFKKLENEPSDITFTNCDFSTPRHPIEKMEFEVLKRKYSELQEEFNEASLENEELKNNIDIQLEEFNELLQEKNTKEDLLKLARDEIQNLDIFKEQIEDDKIKATKEVEETMKCHYEENLKRIQNTNETELQEKLHSVRSEYDAGIQKLSNVIQDLEHNNYEIKTDYCQLAAEKETIERHYEKLENKLKRVEESKNNTEALANTVDKSVDESAVEKEVGQLREKLRTEAEIWAKEKRRLESKIRHTHKNRINNCNQSSQTVEQDRNCERSSNNSNSCYENKENEHLYDKISELRQEYKKTLKEIQVDVKLTINKLVERNQVRIKTEVSSAQKRMSNKLHEHYRQLLLRVLEESPRAEITLDRN